MKRLIITALVGLLCLLTIFLAASVYNASFDIVKWRIESRQYVAMGMIVTLVFTIIGYNNIAKD